jgi:MOSC domain-containing protein YiiM
VETTLEKDRIVKRQKQSSQTRQINSDNFICEVPLSLRHLSSTSTGRIVALSISKKKGIPKTNVESAKLIENFGIEGDIHAGNWHRQISILALESIETMREKGLANLRPGAFAENITTEFLELPNLEVGTKLRIGNETELEITQIGKECHNKCAIYFKVGDCVMPREGIFAKVIKGGDIFIDDKIDIFSK